MANFVIKRDGTREAFDAGKIKSAIGAAADTTNMDPQKIQELVEDVSSAVIAFAAGKEEIATTEIREKALAELDTLAPEVAASWREYDRLKGRA